MKCFQVLLSVGVVQAEPGMKALDMNACTHNGMNSYQTLFSIPTWDPTARQEEGNTMHGDDDDIGDEDDDQGMVLYTSTFHLKLSTFCWMNRVGFHPFQCQKSTYRLSLTCFERRTGVRP